MLVNIPYVDPLWDVVLQNCIISEYLPIFYLDLPTDNMLFIHMILPYLIIKVVTAVFAMNVTLMTSLNKERRLNLQLGQMANTSSRKMQDGKAIILLIDPPIESPTMAK